MKINYTTKAKRDLKNILQYYQLTKNLKKGRQIRAKLILRTAELREFPKLGKKEIDFSLHYNKVCRGLNCGNHKIIYHIDEKEEVVFILEFYDMRRG
jgi:plasmid stabilization system protein ParE